MDPTEPSDDELVRRHRAGDKTAFPLLFQRWERPAFAFILSRVGNHAAAADVFQQTWLNVFMALAPDGTYEPRGNLKGFLFRTAQNAGVDYQRRHRHDPRPLDDDTNDSQDKADLVPSRELSAEDAAIAVEQYQVIMDCVQQCLHDDQRAAFILVDVEEKKFREAAEILGVPIGTVMSRVGRARVELQECLRRRGIEF